MSQETVGVVYVRLLPQSLPSKCTHGSFQAPLNDAIEYTEFDFENPFAHPSIYRGPPTPELETAWDELWNGESLRCSNGSEDAHAP